MELNRPNVRVSRHVDRKAFQQYLLHDTLIENAHCRAGPRHINFNLCKPVKDKKEERFRASFNHGAATLY